MTDQKFYTAAQAAAYINARLPDEDRWNDSINTLQYHRLAGNIRNVPVEGEEDKERITVLYAQEEMDRFLETRRRPGLPLRFDLAPWEDQMGRVPDTEIARQVGCHTRTVTRWREKRGIPKIRN